MCLSKVDESGMLSIDSVEAVFETIVQNKTEESGWLDSVSNFFTGKVCSRAFYCNCVHHSKTRRIFSPCPKPDPKTTLRFGPKSTLRLGPKSTLRLDPKSTL